MNGQWISEFSLLLMTLLLTIRPAESGQFLYIPYNGTRPNNTAAQSICASYKSCQLAVVDTQAEYYRMYDYFNRTLGPGFVLPTGFWIGLYWIDTPTGPQPYTHFWENRGRLVEMTWALWDVGEPNAPLTEKCGRIHTTMLYRSINCDGTYDVLCEGIGSGSCLRDSKEVEECKLFAPCWWTPAKIGLTAGFSSLFVLFCLCCTTWKCFCAHKNQVGYETEDNDSDDDMNENVKHGGLQARPHNIMKNYNVDHMPVSSLPSHGINSVILRQEDAPWKTPEEISFESRYAYKE